MQLDVSAEVILSQLGYSNNESSLRQAQKAIEVTKGYEKFAKHILTLNDHLKKMNAYVGLSNKTDYLKIKCDENDSKEILDEIKAFISKIADGILKEVLAAKNINVVEATVSNVNDIQQAAQSLVGKVDAVYAPTDNVIASAMPTLVAITDEAKIPVFCGEGGMVKAGGLATVGIDYYKLGLQTGAMAARILSGKEKPATMAIESQKEMQTIVNTEAAKKLGITIPADVLEAAKASK